MFISGVLFPPHTAKWLDVLAELSKHKVLQIVEISLQLIKIVNLLIIFIFARNRAI